MAQGRVLVVGAGAIGGVTAAKLTEADLRSIVEAEERERCDAAQVYEQLGRDDLTEGSARRRGS